MSAMTAGVSSCGRATAFCTSDSLERSTSAQAGSPTSSSAPTPWCSCARAARSTEGSIASTSELAAAPASLAKRRNDLCALSSDLRSSSCTQATALRSSLVSLIVVRPLCCYPAAPGRGAARPGARVSGDLEPRHRLLQLLGGARQLAHHL